MDVLKCGLIGFALLVSTGCQIGYLLKNSYEQLSLLSQRNPIEKALKDPNLNEKQRKKLQLAVEAKYFAQDKLGLKGTKNYTSFVLLDRPYVTYVVNAAPKWKLEHYLWSYPIIGEMPYKGYFNEQDAKDEEEKLKTKGLDTYLRGVAAYSTLGWFHDPILSSMLNYSDEDLVNTIIHETTHVTIFIKHEADFNERLATFIGNKGTELFYLNKEGKDSEMLKKIADQNADQKIFSTYISDELNSLKKWYEDLPPEQQQDELRAQKFKEIQNRFNELIVPKLKTQNHLRFAKINLNNARLMLYTTYVKDLEKFEELYNLSGQNIKNFIENCKSLESSKNPNLDLEKLVENLKEKTK